MTLKRQPQIIEGLGVSPGVAIGRAVCIESRPQEVYRLSAATDIAFHDMELFGDLIYVVYSDNQGTYHNATSGGTDISGLRIYSLEDDPELPTLVGTYLGEDVFSTDPQGWNWTKRFELVEVRGHLVVLSSPTLCPVQLQP